MNVGRHFTLGFEQLTGGTARLGHFSRGLIEIGYWLFTGLHPHDERS